VGGLMERSRPFGVDLVLPCPHSEAALRRSPDPIPVLAAVAVGLVLNCRRPERARHPDGAVPANGRRSRSEMNQPRTGVASVYFDTDGKSPSALSAKG